MGRYPAGEHNWLTQNHFIFLNFKYSSKFMPATNAIILIPDISGFTRFMGSMELEHASHIITDFLETIVQHSERKFEVSEIEGDAVLLYKKGGLESKQEMLDQCLSIFHAFHYQRKVMQQVVLCHCGACQSIINLSLKFVAHYGIISEIKVNRFVKASGMDMIIAHRLLKNNIHSDEYILLTEKFLQQLNDHSDQSGLTWQLSAEEFPSIGKVNFEFALLEDLKSKVPDPPKNEINYSKSTRAFFELEIAASFKDVYMAVIDMPNRIHWMKDLKEVKQEGDHPFVGSVHHCIYKDVHVKVSPALVRHEDLEIFYAETHTAEAMNTFAIYEFLLELHLLVVISRAAFYLWRKSNFLRRCTTFFLKISRCPAIT